MTSKISLLLLVGILLLVQSHEIVTCNQRINLPPETVAQYRARYGTDFDTWLAYAVQKNLYVTGCPNSENSIYLDKTTWGQ